MADLTAASSYEVASKEKAAETERLCVLSRPQRAETLCWGHCSMSDIFNHGACADL